MERYDSPFEAIPYQFYVQSPVGLAPKVGTGQGSSSICHMTSLTTNLSILYPMKYCSIHYNDLNHAVKMCLNILKQHPNTNLWFGKMDILSAFHILPTSPKFWNFLILIAEDPSTGLF